MTDSTATDDLNPMLTAEEKKQIIGRTYRQGQGDYMAEHIDESGSGTTSDKSRRRMAKAVEFPHPETVLTEEAIAKVRAIRDAGPNMQAVPNQAAPAAAREMLTVPTSLDMAALLASPRLPEGYEARRSHAPRKELDKKTRTRRAKNKKARKSRKRNRK